MVAGPRPSRSRPAATLDELVTRVEVLCRKRTAVHTRLD